LVNIDTPRVHASNEHVNSNVKLETVNKQRIGNVSTHNTWLINGHFRNVINNENATTLGRIGGLDNPLVESFDGG
jgi:hypothetical protein